MVKIALDAGHGLYTGGKRMAKSIDSKETREWVLNDRIVRMVEEGLKQYKDVEVLRVDDRTGKNDISLSQRVRKVNNFNADVLFSYHHNAGIGGGVGGGITVHRAIGSSRATIKYQKDIYDLLIKHTGLKGNRASPLSQDNFYIIRNVKAPGVLIEHGFMDSRTDGPIILTDKFARQCADAHIEFFVKEFILVEMGGVATVDKGYYVLGDEGDKVRELQQSLRDLTYTIEVDGKFDSDTHRVVKYFQERNGLTVDGSAGPATLSKIKELSTVKPSAPTPDANVQKVIEENRLLRGIIKQVNELTK